MIEDVIDFLKTIGSIILIIVLVISILIGVVIGFDIIYNKNYCKTMQSLQPKFEFQWELWGGCLVKTPSGFWINAKDYNYLENDVK